MGEATRRKKVLEAAARTRADDAPDTVVTAVALAEEMIASQTHWFWA